MAQRQFRLDDTSAWGDRFGSGSDGAFTPSSSTDAPIDSAATGTSGATSLTATNASFTTGQLILIHQSRGSGAGQWELNKIASYSTGTITTAYPLINTYVSPAQVLVLKQYTGVTISGGVTVTAKAWNGTTGGILAYLCNGTISVAGTLDATGKGHAGGVTGNPGTVGEGTTGAASGSAVDTGGSGGGYSGGWAGNGGGNGTAGTGGASSGGTAGIAVGNAGLTLMDFGGGGSGGDGGIAGGNGGNGGGIIILIGKITTITGSVLVTGQAGGVTASGRPGGGGAAGSVLVKGQNVTLGSTLITGNGGQGGQTGVNSPAGDGGSGRIHIDYSALLSGSTTPTLDSRRDGILADSGGSFIFNML